MKKFFLASCAIIISLTLYCQTPEAFSFHSMVRDGAGQPLTDQTVSFRFGIIKESPAGESVYQEIHNVITDPFGFVSLVIGKGSVIHGSFETIDWGNDSYFLKVEIDTEGGILYTDMGSTQLLSVPYALHSKTAANVFSGDYNDLINKPVTDGSETKMSAGENMVITGSGTITNPYIITNGFSGDYNDLRNKPITDGSETKLSGEDNIITEGTGTIDNPYVIRERTHYVGESYGGGIVFCVYDNGRHGLIASTSDQDPGIEWYNGTRRYTNTTGDGLKAGEMNTAIIIAMQTNDNQLGNFAAKVCADYSINVDGVMYGDWYLPSKHELAILFIQKDVVGNFNSEYYWSSTEFSSISAWCQNFETGVQVNLNKSFPYSVRAIRAF